MPRGDRPAEPADPDVDAGDRAAGQDLLEPTQGAWARDDPARGSGRAAARAGHAALVGLAPFNHDSGCWKGQRRIKGGRADVRRVLYMAIWASIRAKSPLANTYARLRAAGKPAKVAIVACMHKFLRWLNAIARDQAPYAPPVIAGA
ncbi:transposase [Xanthomonas sacchari]